MTGSRWWGRNNQRHASTLNRLIDSRNMTVMGNAFKSLFVDDKNYLLEGEALGADKMAAEIVRLLKWEVISFPADWGTYGKRAGFIRNDTMIAAEPDHVLAFKDDFDFTMKKGGTEHAVRCALAKNIPVILYSGWDIYRFSGHEWPGD